MQSETDAVLIGRIVNGEADAARVLVERHTPALRRLLLRAGARAGDVDDLLQEIWMRVIRSAHRYDPAQEFVAWLFAIAINRLRTLWSRRRDERGLDSVPEASVHPTIEDALVIREQIARLPPHLADAILLRFFEDLSEKDMAQRLGVPAGTVKSRLHNAIKRLKDNLEGILYA